MRLLFLALALSAPLIGCKRAEPAPSAEPAAPSASAALAPSASAASVASARRPQPAARIKGKYTPPDDPPAASTSAAAPSPSAPATGKRPLGTIDDWVKAYDGNGSPERKTPPRLGVLADLPKLPPSTLAYVRSGQILRVDLPAGTERPLTTGPGYSGDPRFTRDGRFLFFVSNREGGVQKIFRMQSDGGGLVAVTRALTSSVLFSWGVSDDGSQVAYARPIENSEEDVYELHLVTVATREDVVIHRETHLRHPSFSRDGKALFFEQGWAEPPGPDMAHPRFLISLDLTTKKATRLPNAGVSVIDEPFDLGDGRLLFVSSVDFSMAGRNPMLQTMPVGGGAWTRIPFPVENHFLHPAPSPDRKKIALSASLRQGGFGADWVSDVVVIPGAGGAGRTFIDGFPRPFYGASGAEWAPDSRHLAFELALCPYSGCEPVFRSVVLVDTEAPAPAKLAFVGYGSSPVLAPAQPPAPAPAPSR